MILSKGLELSYDPEAKLFCMEFTDKELGHTVTVKFDGNFKNAVLWSQCPLGFVCMEPWNGFPGSLTTPEHETLAPGNALSAVMSVEI